MLTGEEIKSRGFVVNATESGYRASSYDVRIECLINSQGATVESYALPTRGIVLAVSRERIMLPGDITGLAMVKTGLCNDGVLALNIGVIDPGWEGKVSSFLVNFSNNERLLTAGDTFLRLTFQQLSSRVSGGTAVPDDVYVSDRRHQVVGRFAPTFLNLSEVIGSLTDEALRRWRIALLTYVTAAAFLLALLTFLLNFGSLYLVRSWLEPSGTVQAELARDALSKAEADLANENSTLSDRVRGLEARLNAMAATPQRPAATEAPQSRPAGSPR